MWPTVRGDVLLKREHLLDKKKSPNQNPLLSGHLCCCLTTFPALRHMTPPHSHIHPMRACRTTEPLATVAVTSEDDTGHWRSSGQDIHITALLGEPGTLLGWGSADGSTGPFKTNRPFSSCHALDTDGSWRCAWGFPISAMTRLHIYVRYVRPSRTALHMTHVTHNVLVC